MGHFADLLKQNIAIFDDRDIASTVQCKPRSGKELHWPKLALGDRYPVTDDRGRILRHEQLQGSEGLL